ncbi:MAG TPA: right-handed parallel beta-helix repeat-containing protein, partial [Pirellulales bacterium]
MKKLLMNRHRTGRLRLRHTFTRLGLEPLEERRLLTVFSVTSTADSGTGTLRDAIVQANSNPGPDTISFNIPGSGVHTITPLTQLPAITDPLTINGDSQPGYVDHPLIELDGSMAGNANGLEFQTGGNFVEGLDIHSFAYDGIVFAEPNGAKAVGGNIVAENYLGTDPTGKIAEPNEEGIHLIHSPNDSINNNLISGNLQSGIFVADQFSTGTRIEGNKIGTDVTGMLPLGNVLNGVALGAPPSPAAGDGYASGIIVGGTDDTQTNIISGNGQSGIWIEGGIGNIVLGNFIGVGKDGTTPLANGAIASPALAQFGTDGIFITGATATIVGGTDDGTGNIISGNAGSGIQITGDATGTLVERNFIGLDLSGHTAVPNQDGVYINGASDNTIGGTGTVRNLISGNKRNGVEITGSAAVGNQVLGNYVGTDKSGLAAVPNLFDGVDIFDAPLNVIGGTTAAARNIISGNSGNGVVISGSNAAGNVVEGNFIGTDATGLAFCPNVGDGVLITPLSDPTVGTGGGVGNIIGGTAAGAGNVISGNIRNGVEINGSTSTGNQVVGNFVGTDATGFAQCPNDLDGVDIFNAPLNVVGGTTAAARNVISSNVGNGVVIAGSNATGNTIEGDYIGIDATGLIGLGNGGDGVLVTILTNSAVGSGGAAGN